MSCRVVKLSGLLAIGLLAITVAWFWSQKDKPIDVPILMYHRIGDTCDSPWWVTVRDFETQLASLQEQGYQSILPSRLVAHQRWGWSLPRKPIIITFDDGYLNVLENAEPLLKKYRFQAVCFLITGMVSESPETRKSWESTPLLSWPEVRDMQKRGTVQFGGHSRTHPNLRAMADPYGEISGCYQDLKKKGGFTPEGFCYPSGQFKPETLACVKRAKFTTAVTCEDGVARLAPGTGLFDLPRVTVMGGWHRFHIEAKAGEPPGISVEVSKEGQPLSFVPRLTWGKGASSFRAGWLPSIQVSSTPVTVTWSIPVAERNGTPILELWDTFRVVLMYRESLNALQGREASPRPPQTAK
ncbi:MAG: polysaccharide deacetylase family protein [bacterium]